MSMSAHPNYITVQPGAADHRVDQARNAADILSRMSDRILMSIKSEIISACKRTLFTVIAEQ